MMLAMAAKKHGKPSNFTDEQNAVLLSAWRFCLDPHA